MIDRLHVSVVIRNICTNMIAIMIILLKIVEFYHLKSHIKI